MRFTFSIVALAMFSNLALANPSTNLPDSSNTNLVSSPAILPRDTSLYSTSQGPSKRALTSDQVQTISLLCTAAGLVCTTYLEKHVDCIKGVGATAMIAGQAGNLACVAVKKHYDQMMADVKKKAADAADGKGGEGKSSTEHVEDTSQKKKQDKRAGLVFVA